MRARQKVSRAGIELIASFEGLRRRAARLPDGRWTIGYGHTLSAREGAEVTPEDAVALLHFDLLPVVEAVNSLVYTPLTDNQFDALVAFAFNVGVDAFRTSDVLKRVNEGRLTEAACAIDLWRKADIGGDPIILDALIRRRAAEKALFLTPQDGFVPTPSPLVRPLVDESLAPALPASRPAEIAVPMTGDSAEVHRLHQPEPEPLTEAEPEVSAEPVELTASVAEVADAQPQDSVAIPAAYSDEIPVESAQEIEVQALETTEPGAEAIAPEVAEAGPAELASAEPSPFPTGISADAPAGAFPAETESQETVAASAPAARVYAPEESAPEAVRYEAEPLPEFAPAPQGDFSPQPAEVSPASMLGVAAPAPMAPTVDLPTAEPVLTTESQAPSSVWTLTPPPENGHEDLAVVHEPVAEEPDELQSPLFDDPGSQPLERVIRYEEVEEPEAPADRPSSGPFILMGLIGFAAFGGAVSAFLKARAGTGGLDELTVVAWVLALIGAACVGTAVYFLLKRLGGAED